MRSMSADWEAEEALTAEWDRTLRTAVAMAAVDIVPTASEREIGEQRHLVPALRNALESLAGADRVATGRRLQIQQGLPDWDPLPGNVDLLVGELPSPTMHPKVGIEVKSRTHSHKLGETPYDIFKMAALRRVSGVEATYLVVAATLTAFSSSEPGAALFNTPLGASEDWHSLYFIQEWRSEWAALLADSSGKPQRVPRLHRGGACVPRMGDPRAPGRKPGH
jgi:hypothetical protein